MTKIIILEFYQSHTEVIKSWVDMFTALDYQTEIYIPDGRKFKIFKSHIEYQRLEKFIPSDDTIYLINTVKTAIKDHRVWKLIEDNNHRKILLFHNYQDFDYFKGQSGEILSQPNTKCLFLCPAIRKKLDKKTRYFQIIPTYQVSKMTSLGNFEKVKDYLVVGRLDFRIRKYEDLIISFSKHINRDDWKCTIVGAKTREKDYRQLITLINKHNLKDKIRVITDCQTDKLISILETTTYVLPLVSNASYLKDTLSGTIPLAMSYGIPMIIDSQLAQVYGISDAIIYQKSLQEVIEKTLKMDQIQLVGIVTKFRQWSQNSYQKSLSEWKQQIRIN